MKTTFINLLLLIPLFGNCQFLDSVRYDLATKPKFVFRLDTRNSFVTSQRGKIFGLKVGWEYNERIRLGIGFNYLTSEIFRDRVYVRGDGRQDTASARLHFNYLSPFLEYVFFRKGKWEHTIPVQIGFGNSGFSYFNEKGREIRDDYRPVILYEPAMTTQYKVFSWLGLGAGVGYRLLLVNNKATGENLNSPVYVIKVKLFFGDIYRAVFPPKDAE